jgi:hypothetical protein
MKTVYMRHHLRGVVDSCVNAVKKLVIQLHDRLTSEQASIR